MNTIDKLGDAETFVQIIFKQLEEFVDDTVTELESSRFMSFSNLTKVELQNLITTNYQTFYSCPKLQEINFPLLQTIGNECFGYCSSFTKLDFPAASWVGSGAFKNCSSLKTVIFRNTSQVPTLKQANAFSGTGGVSIYVPDSLVDSYKEATNWSTHADKIKPLSELPAEEGE